MKKCKMKKGFTFVEIIISIAIVAILIAVAIPAYKAIKTSAERTAHNALLYFTDFPKEKSVTSEVLFKQGYLKNDVKVPSSIPAGTGNDSKIYTVTVDDNGVIKVSPDKVEAKKTTGE